MVCYSQPDDPRSSFIFPLIGKCVTSKDDNYIKYYHHIKQESIISRRPPTKQVLKPVLVSISVKSLWVLNNSQSRHNAYMIRSTQCFLNTAQKFYKYFTTFFEDNCTSQNAPIIFQITFPYFSKFKNKICQIIIIFLIISNFQK
jgi:hypothetical protein